MRLSLLVGAGALGWMALGASGASAADLPAERGLLGSVTDVVETTAAPALAAVTEPAAPLVAATGLQQTPVLPLVSDVAARVPQLLSEPVGSVLSPVTTTVDRTLAQVPVVGQIVPTGTVTGITTPVTGIVDGAVGGVVEPVLGVVAPVTDIVAPVVEALPVPVAVPPVAVLPSPVVTAPVAVVPQAPVPAEPVEAVAVPEPAVPTAGSAQTPVTRDASADPAQAASRIATPAAIGAIGSLPADLVPSAPVSTVLERLVEPLTSVAGATLTAWVASTDETSGALPTVLSSFSGGTSSMTGAGSAAPLAALAAAAFLVVLLLTGRRGHPANADLPSGPSFDPGSSPD
ncbi:hypothetical protein ASF21_09235 [Arthrobacter sp. Leaf234]|uniref:hypothetical protein n=1 Tax=Arthrobacter sp. Leaf234 TaxID=1736303 RepID=UPI0006F9851B|nr:hypothetical protein [Arthrobacter sp. Leaf234]KQO01764.1 hypothetical protein ASF21_09235 [Arthrobacter sp. Leaf234]